MLVLIFLIQSAFAVDSLPEFECTAIRIDSNKAPQILGDRKHPSVSLRKFPNSDWEFNIKNKKFILGNTLVSKKNDLLKPSFDYTVQHEGNSLEFHLVGNPPSRNGYLRLLNKGPIVSEVLAKITCH